MTEFFPHQLLAHSVVGPIQLLDSVVGPFQSLVPLQCTKWLLHHIMVPVLNDFTVIREHQPPS